MTTVGFDVSALDDSFKEHSKRGIGRYVRELHRQLQLQQSESLVVSEFDHRTFAPGSLFDRVPVGKTTLKQQIVFPTKLWFQGSKDFDIFHFPAHMDAPSWCRVPYILTVLDLIPIVCEDLYKADRPNWRFLLARWLEKKAIQNASMILAISEHTAKDVSSMLNIPPERVHVTPLGVDEQFFQAKAPHDEASFRKLYGIPADRPIVLYVGGIDQRKNYWTLIEAFEILLERCSERGQTRPVLCMAGKIEKDRQFPKLLECIENADLSSDVCLLGFVPDEDLTHLLAISKVFCFLSLYEGFGLPVLEAMAAGTPVVASNTSSIPEVLGDVGMAVNPESANQAADALFIILSNIDLAKDLSERGRLQARKYTWESTAEKTLLAYEELARLISSQPVALGGI